MVSYFKTMSCLLGCTQDSLHVASMNEVVVRHDTFITHYTVTHSFAINVLNSIIMLTNACQTE